MKNSSGLFSRREVYLLPAALLPAALLPAALAAWSWDGLECCCSCGSLGTFSFWYEFSNLGPVLFLCMAKLKTLSEIVRF